VLHRDVKPANILISEFGEPTLADFGLAILVEARDTADPLDALTPAYAPPEAHHHAPPSPAGDVYSLCATLYAMLGGHPPDWPDGISGWRGTPAGWHEARTDRHDGPADAVHRQTDPGAWPIRQVVQDLPGVPAELMSLLRLGMHPEESARPSALQLRDALTALTLEGARPVAVPTLDPRGVLRPAPVDGGHVEPEDPAATR
jgi:serine/threonine protein kinase